MAAFRQAYTQHLGRRHFSVGLLANNVAWRIIVTYPQFPARISGDTATHQLRAAPDYLRVVPASRRAGIGLMIVVGLLRHPGSDNARWSCMRS
jgi:hypothetical protein